MDAFNFLQLLGTVAGGIASGISIARGVRGYLESFREAPTTKVLELLNQLGCQTDRQIRHLVADWNPPTPVTDEQRDELTNLLINLTRGARGHTTRGTPSSSFTRCSEIIDQLLRQMETYRKRGQPVSGGLVDWKLERFLGKGAFGEVWMGRNPGHPEPRAFKFFTQPGASDWLIAREQRTLYRVRAQLNRHPNIVEFIDVITRGTQCPFLVLEYVGGGSLEEWILARSHRAPLKKQEIMLGVIRGLSEAHTAGIYHRDLKPANVLLTPGPDVQAKIADFGLGLAEGEGDAAAGSPISEAILVGTTMYLPPEALQPFIRREPAQDDVFALGVLWYQFLVERLERPPYDFADHLRVAGVDSHTIHLIQRCLAHPDRRFADTCEVETALIEIPEVIWNPPQGCIDISSLAREYLAGLPR